MSAKQPLPANGFTFKQFFVAHDRCAMKVSTDSILLGAWAPVVTSTRILDIGTGSGLLALMLAQRSSAGTEIDAVELDTAATMQARLNVAHSPWPTRIRVHQDDIKQWAPRQKRRYSLIISNPPYFATGIACASAERHMARSTSALMHAELLLCAEMLTEAAGYFCLILPLMAGKRFVDMAQARGWYLRRYVEVKENDVRPPHRVMLALSTSYGELMQQQLAIRDAEGRYSAAYRHLTRDFYLD